jgi:hypothetical protein
MTTNNIDRELTEAELDQVVGGWGRLGSLMSPHGVSPAPVTGTLAHEPVHAS